MGAIFVIGILTATSIEARQKILDQFGKIIAYTKPEEPGVNKYCICIPRDESDDKTIYALEEYADQTVSDAHLATKPVQDLIALLGTGLLAGAPNVLQLSPSSAHVRPEVSNIKDPYILLTTRSRGPGESASSAEDECARAQAYSVLEDAKDKSTIRTLKVYESEREAPERDSETVELKMSAGYLYKETGDSHKL